MGTSFGKLVYIMPPFIIQPGELSKLTHSLVKIVRELKISDSTERNRKMNSLTDWERELALLENKVIFVSCLLSVIWEERWR